MKRIHFACLGLMLAATGAMAAMSRPVQLSLTPEIAVFDREDEIRGVTLNIWGENPQKALALGIVNGSTGDSAGVSLALLLNYAENYTGVQWAPINYTSMDFLGWQSGFVNYTGGTMRGLQSGIVNYAGRLRGLQLGLINYAETASAGVQLGLINVITSNTRWFTGLPGELAPAMVFLNWSF
jgi:hypothetical protein